MKHAAEMSSDTIESSLCRLIRCTELLIGRYWYLPAN
jgi:hypothetical protein